MSAPVAQAPAPQEERADAARAPRRRWRTVLVWTALVLSLTTLVALVAGGRPATDEPLDPDNPRGSGARALAQVLQQQGVDLTVVRDHDALLDLQLGPDTTLVVSRTAHLGEDTGPEALQRARDAAGVVLLDPDPGLPDALGLPVTGSASPSPGPLTAVCSGPLVDDGDTIGGASVLFRSTAPGAELCFPPSESFNAGGAASGHLVQLPADGGRPPVLLVGAPEIFSNDRITEQAHAAIALRALGRSQRLVWYVPTITDTVTGGTDFYSQLPPFVVPSLFLLAGAVVVLLLWQGRRLGRLVTEPLPVVVRAAETTESRGRLYRRANDRERALAALQAGTRHRLAPWLGLGVGTRPQELAQAVAEASGRDTDEVTRLLFDPRAGDDAALLHTATQLAALEEEVHRT